MSGTTTAAPTQMKHDIHKFRKVTHLTDENWITFKFEIKAALQERGLWEVVDGTTDEKKGPNQSKGPDGFRRWKDQNASARAQIIQNLSPEVQPIVHDADTSADVWQALKDEYESDNLDRVANVREVYDHLAYIEGTPMRDHINKLKILREQLSAMGDAIPETSHAIRMLRLLPPSWDGVAQVLRTTQPTIKRVKDRLLAEEQARKTAAALTSCSSASALMSTLRDPSALVNVKALLASPFGTLLMNQASGNTTEAAKSSGNDKTRQSKLRNPNLQCSNTNCGRKGHTIERCWAKGGGQEGKGPRSKIKSNKVQESNGQIISGNLAKGDRDKFATKSPKTEETVSIAVTDVAWIASTVDKSTFSFNIDWIIDSAASTHVTPNKELFESYFDFGKSKYIGTADQGVLEACGIGNIKLELPGRNRGHYMILRNVLFAPKCASNLLSVSSLTKDGYSVVFIGKECHVRDANNTLVIRAVQVEGQVYSLTAKAHKSQDVSINRSISVPRQIVAYQTYDNASSKELLLWHERFGHINFRTLRDMINRKMVKGIRPFALPTEDPYCENCTYGKMSVTPFSKKSLTSISGPLDLVVADICGPMPSSISGKRYFIAFVDVYSRYTWVYYLKNRSDVSNILPEFHKRVERESGKMLRRIRTDNAKEFVEGQFANYCRSEGIIQESTAPYSSSSNGIVERVLRTIQEAGLAILHQCELGTGFWPEAVDAPVYVRRRSIHSGISAIPYKKWNGQIPNVSNLRVFGSKIKFIIHPKIRTKFQYHAEPGRFVGYYDDPRSYKVWLPATHCFYKTRSFLF